MEIGGEGGGWGGEHGRVGERGKGWDVGDIREGGEGWGIWRGKEGGCVDREG